ncbi:MAG TPA: DUF397 domain-containing protein [Actinomycetes bacterium]|nr:DUF397 domain-containing protein [Actinomycetes bacterium]
MEELRQFVHASWRVSTFCDTASCVEIAVSEDQQLIAMRDSKRRLGSPLIFQADEWQDFVAGIRNGEFDLPG